MGYSHSDLKLKKVDELKYANLTIPVWQIAEKVAGAYPGQFVRHEDLPDELRQAFEKSQISAQMPFDTGSYVHDFAGFMSRGGNGWGYDFSAVVMPYISER